MQRLKIIVLALLCLALILPFAACGDENESNMPDGTPVNDAGNAETSGGDNGGAVESGENAADPNMPEIPGYDASLGTVDMDNRAFTFFVAGWAGSVHHSSDISQSEEWVAGDPIDDAALARKMKIEEMFNVRLVQVDHENRWGDTSATQFQTTVRAGDNAYDVGVMRCGDLASLITANILTDLKDLPYLDMDKPYWNKSFYDSVSILGNHFGANGDISKGRLGAVHIMAFNKQMIQNLGMDSPFDLVKNGQWTFDKMMQMSREAARDVNASGQMTLAEDIWGLNYSGDVVPGMIGSLGARMAEKDSDGIPRLTVASEVTMTRLLHLFDNLRDHTHSIDTLYALGGGRTGFADVEVFGDGRALLLATSTHAIAGHEGHNLRALDIDFGIIPYPKWDEASAHTPTVWAGFHTVFTIPQTNHDLVNTSIILEAMAYEGYKNITPEYYENLLKTKTARDDESEEMIDFIFGNLVYDIGFMFNFGGLVSHFSMTMSERMSNTVASVSERNAPVWQRNIDSLVNAVSGF